MKTVSQILIALLTFVAFSEIAKGDSTPMTAALNQAKLGSADAYIARGEAEYRRGDPAAALTNYKKAVQLKPDLVSAPEDWAQSRETGVTNEIGLQAAALIQAKDYDKLDQLAEKYRSSKERYADGVWKLTSFYDGMVLSKHAPVEAWDARLDTFARWTLARPDSITARVAWANALTDYAWIARGSGETDTVSSGGWRLFFGRLTQAVQILKGGMPLKEKCPIYWSVLLRTALGLHAHRPQFDTIFETAIKTEPDNAAYYFRRAIYLLPRWYGTNGEWQSDLGESTGRIIGDNGDKLYAQVVWNMESYYKENPFIGGSLSWERLDNGFAVIEKQFPDSLAAKIERATLAVLLTEARATVIYNSGRAKQDRGDLDGAMDDYSKAIKMNPNYLYAYVHRGIVKHQKRDLKGAMADYNKAIEIAPDYNPAFYNRGVTKQAEGDIDGAMADYTKAIQLRPDDSYAYVARGSLRQYKGDQTGAAADFEVGNKLRSKGK
jgi:tetratricopeptide (TPR) repeat protein